MNRREFIRAGAVAAAAAPMIARAAEGDPYKGLKVGVHSYSLRSFPLDKAIELTGELGVKFFSVNPIHIPLKSTPEQLAEARKKIADAGLTLLEAGVIGIGQDIKAARAVFEYAKALGLKNIVAKVSLDAFDTIDTLLKDYDIRVAIHNHGPSDTYKVPQDILTAIKGHDPRIGACVDIGHYERAGAKGADSLRQLKGHIFDVHFKDVSKTEEKGGPVVVGTGVIDIPAVFKTLLDMKYPDGVMLEYEADAKNPMPGMKKSFEYVRSVLAKV
jgi:sugar phosphate isomerase/epimerase